MRKRRKKFLIYLFSKAQFPFSPIPILMVTGVWALTIIGSGVCIFYIVKKTKKAKEAVSKETVKPNK